MKGKNIDKGRSHNDKVGGITHTEMYNVEKNADGELKGKKSRTGSSMVIGSDESKAGGLMAKRERLERAGRLLEVAGARRD